MDKTGKPVPEVDLWFGRQDNGIKAWAESDSAGRFRAALVPQLPYNWGLSSLSHCLPRQIEAISVGSGQTYNLGDVVLDEKPRKSPKR